MGINAKRFRRTLIGGMALLVGLAGTASAGSFGPITVADQTPAAPLANPVPSSYQPRYVSGFGNGDSFTVFFEDRDAGSRISYASTSTGPAGLPSAVTGTDIADTHFVVKDWPIRVGDTDYDYRAWGSVGNNPSHNFYVSNNLTNWVLVSTFTIPNAAEFTDAHGWVYYGFHDVIMLNGTYYAFAESNQSQTMLVRSDNGDDVWEAFASVGGRPGWGPLELPAGVSYGWTPSGSFVDLGHDRGYGKIHVDPRDSNVYLAVNTAAKASLPPAELEAAFIDPGNWTWHDGTTGPAANAILAETAEHDLRECWVALGTDPDDDWILVYDADFGSVDGGKALGYATLSPPLPPPETVWVDDDYCDGCANGGHTWGYDAFDSIQDGIDAVAGSTVHVAVGTYDSTVEAFPILIDKPLTLLGAQADQDPRPSHDGRSGSESLIDADETSSAVIRISASDVEINGFTITGGTGDMVEENGSADHLLFRYNILYDDLATEGDEAIQIKYSDGVVMEYNYAYNIKEDAFNLSSSTNGVVRYNEAHDIHSSNAAIYCYDEANIDIIGNLVYDVPNNDGIKLGDAGDGSTGGEVKDNEVYDVAEDGVTIYASGVAVENNDIYHCDSENGALYLYGADDSTVANNRVHDNDAIGLLIVNSDHVAVTHNEICRNDDTNDAKYPDSAGIWLAPDASDIAIHYNDIDGNAGFGVMNAATTEVGATCNWWGAPSGPSGVGSGVGDAVSGAVDFEPWLLAPGPDAPCGGVIMASFVIDCARIDFKKKPDDDKVQVQGRLELDLVSGDDVDISEQVVVTVGPLSETIIMVEKGRKGGKWEYKRPKGSDGDINHMTIDWKSGRFDIHIDKADLAGATNPVFISVRIGDDVGTASVPMREKKHHWDYEVAKAKAVEIGPVARSSELEVVAYPNPIRDVHTATFQVMGALAAEVEEILVQIYDLSGRLVWEDTAPGSELGWHTDSLSGDYLANGFYLYRVMVKVGGSWMHHKTGTIAVLR